MSQDPAQLVNVTILFADLLDSVRISSVLDFWAYDDLITEYQHYLNSAADEIGSELVAERYVKGDELVLFLYDRNQVERNRAILSLPEGDPKRKRLEAENAKCDDEALFAALRAGIMLKNAWLSSPVNFHRVTSRQLPFDLGIGIHSGLCVLRERSDGSTRIEGYAINFAKRIESYSRMGRVTRLMLSRTATQHLRFVRRQHVVVRQRLGFISHKPSGGDLKGLQAGLELFELKFFHRLQILPPEDKAAVFEQLLRNDPVNIWAYHMSVENYIRHEASLDKARELALLAYANLPDNEKICYDLGTIAKLKGELEQARFFAGRAVELNREWDLPLGLLCELEYMGDADPKKMLAYQRRGYALCPDSPQRCWDLGEAYLHADNKAAAKEYIGDAVSRHPDYLKSDEKRALAKELGIITETEPDAPTCE
jgi:class 3 adenylate cyclase